MVITYTSQGSNKKTHLSRSFKKGGLIKSREQLREPGYLFFFFLIERWAEGEAV